MSNTDDQLGKVFGNRYELKHKIARGGMADVYLAHDQLLDRNVALKVLFRELSTDANFVARFRREAQNAARLNHPNIVAVYDWGEENNTYYIVMEYINGLTLSEILKSKGPFTTERAASIGAEVAAALAFAHRNGVIHRDVKPGNIMIDDRDLVKVTDFGIARARNSSDNLTQTGAVMGTATYFSPEQAQGHAIDQRSDVYSLGIVLFELVSGQPPFRGENPVSIAYKHVREEPPLLSSVNNQIAIDYAVIVARSLAKNPSDRYVSAEDLRNDLLRFINHKPITTSVPPVYEDLNSLNSTTVMSATRAINRTPAEKQRSVVNPFLAFLVVLLVIAIAGIVTWTQITKQGGDKVEVDDVVGLQYEDAVAQLKTKELNAVKISQAGCNDTVDKVMSQDPAAREKVTKNSQVKLQVCAGPNKIRLQNYSGQEFSKVEQALTELKLRVTKIEMPNDTYDSGQVIQTRPSSNTEVEEGSLVQVEVSTGRKEVIVPNVVGLSVAEAADVLGKERLGATVVEGTGTSEIVSSSSPSPGEKITSGSKVRLFVESTTTTTGFTTTTTSKSTTTTSD